MKYDDSEFYSLNFETALAPAAACTHIGMYLAWAAQAGLCRDDPADLRWTAAMASLRARRLTGGPLLSKLCDGKLTERAFNASGNAFTAAYYGAHFHQDYAAVFASQMPSSGHDADDLCSVPDTWAHFELLQPVLDRRHAQWQAGGLDAPAPPAAQATAPDLATLRRRAEGGDAEAWLLIGLLHITGAQGPRDAAKAADAYEKAAQAGQAEAAFRLSACYERGDGRPQDRQQCLRWLALAAEAGHAQAAFLLAMAYRRGDDVPQDWVAADALMRLAAQRGVEQAAGAVMAPGQQEEVAALAARMAEPGALVALLAARRRQREARREAQAGAAAATANAAGRAPSGLARAALGLGAINLLSPLLLGSLTRSQVQLLTWPLALIGAWGVYVVAPSRGVRGNTRVVCAVLAAALGALGGLINLWLLLRSPEGKSD